MWPAAWTAGPPPSGRQRRSRIRIADRPRFSASHSVVARSSGRAKPLMAGIIRAVVDPSLPDPEKLAAVRSAIPSLAAGIYLNTGSVGPLPAETAAAMAEIAAYERDLGRAHMDYFNDFLDRMNEARAGVAAVLGTDVGAVGLNHATTDGMNAATLLPDWRAGGRAVTTAHEHAGGIGPPFALRRRDGLRVTFGGRGGGGARGRHLAPFRRALPCRPQPLPDPAGPWTAGRGAALRRGGGHRHDRGALVVVDGAQA